MLRDDLLPSSAREWRLASEHLVQHAREAVHVAAMVKRRIARCLLGTHVRRCTDDDTGLRQSATTGLLESVGNAEIADHRMPRREQNVLWLDIAMDDPLHVGVGEG